MRYKVEEIRKQVENAIVESSVEGHTDLNDLTNNLLDLFFVSKRISDEEIEEIAKKEIPYSNGCYSEGEYSEGRRDGFEEGLEYYRDKLMDTESKL